MLTVLRPSRYDDLIGSKTFFGKPAIHDGSAPTESSCQITPEVIGDTARSVASTDGEVWLTVQKESPLPTGDPTSGYSGVMTITRDVFVNTDGYQLHLNIQLDPNDHSIELNDANGQIVQEMMGEFLAQWNTGSRPVLPTS